MFEGIGGAQIIGTGTLDLQGRFRGVGGAQIIGTGEFTAEDLEIDPPVVLPEPGGSVTPPPLPPIVVPDNVKDPVIRQESHTYGPPVLDGQGNPVGWKPTQKVSREYARLQIVVEGNDITWLNGVPTPLPSWSRTEPFGSYSAVIRLPQLTTFHARPAWLKKGANVSLRLVRADNGATLANVFTGAVVKVGRREDDQDLSLTCHGIMFLADLQVRRPSTFTAPQDIGHAIAKAINDATSRRYDRIAPVVTGASTSVLGAWEPLLSGYVQTLLSTALTNGRQWTVSCRDRSPALEMKDTTTEHWTVRSGQPGVDIDLEDDAAVAPNRRFGEGINPDGGAWMGWQYPNWRPDETPPYPNANPNRTHGRGARDSDTGTGRGISDWERKAGLPVDGYLSTSDIAEMRRIQARMGVNPDGRLGPQTWAGTFRTGSNTGSLDGAFIKPLAAAPEVMPRLYGPDGDDLGPNPRYNPDVIVVDEYTRYGYGVTRKEAERNAREALARDAKPGWQGTITFQLDPPGGSKFEILEGHNVRVLGWAGENPLLHVAAVDVSPEGEGSPVRLTVDTKARDYPRLEAIRARERDAVDPAKIAYKKVTAGGLSTDRPIYDSESPGGHVPRHAIFRGLWNVLRIPMGVYGTVARTEFRTTGPAQPFSVAVFRKAVTANQLAARIGNPLSDGNAPWNKDLSDLGLIQSWGDAAQPAGYWPDYATRYDGESGAPVTGRLQDDTSWTYHSDSAPWLWVAVIASNSGYIEGRLFGAVN